MGVLARILGWVGFGGRAKSLRAGYDAARTTDQNRKHWANADALGPNASLSPAVRAMVRQRARYEVANNSIARGIVLTLGNDTIGRGPRLQILTPDPMLNARIEASFRDWATRVDLAGKLRTIRMGRTVDGESFALLVTNPQTRHPVQLDLRLIEPDQVTHGRASTPNFGDATVDGIDLDRWGNPVRYHVLREHPGESLTQGDPVKVAPENMVHWWRVDRAGQARGMSELAPALGMFAVSRRYTMASLHAAELAAQVAGTIKTPVADDDDVPALPEPMDVLQLDLTGALVLPHGTEFAQVKAEQPTTTFPDFRTAIINEIARCLNMPLNIAAGNSSGYNYASGRLDHQLYRRSIDIDQADCEAKVLDHVLRAWLREAALVGIVPAAMLVDDELPHYWFWPGHEHVDPTKEANAQATRLASMSTTLADEYAKQGDDWREQLRQIAEERRYMAELGLTPPGTSDSTSDDDDDLEDEELDPEDADARGARNG